MGSVIRMFGGTLGGVALAAGLFAGAGAPVAGAQPADTSACAKSQTKEFSWPGSAGTPYFLTKEVIGEDTVAPGGQITYRTTVRGSGALIDRIEDFHPQGFELVSARESVWKLVGGQRWTDVTDAVRKDSTVNSVYKTSAGWTTAGEARVSLETTYKVPEDAEPGSTLNSGAGFSAILLNGDKVANPIDTCVTVREPNAVENVTGSLDGLGLGSLTSGSTSSATISSDPAGFVSDIINGVDLSKVLGS